MSDNTRVLRTFKEDQESTAGGMEAPTSEVNAAATVQPETSPEVQPGTSSEIQPGPGVFVPSATPLQGGRALPAPSFTVVEVPDAGMSFAKEWRPSMATPNYIGETSMLLEYLKRLERLHKVTMPIKACGIDPILFKNVTYLSSQEAGSENEENDELISTIFSIPTPGDEGDAPLYELILVDKELYMSCLSECLDQDYLNSIIAEATSTVKAFGRYIYQMVGFKKLALESGQQEGRLLNTLRLNTYEMSVLISYMQQFKGIQVTYKVIEDKQCICFDLPDFRKGQA